MSSRIEKKLAEEPFSENDEDRQADQESEEIDQSPDQLREGLERITDPDELERRIENKLETAERDLEFAEAALGTRAGAIASGIEIVGQEGITVEEAEEAKETLGKVKSLIKRIKEEGVKEIARSGAEGVKNFLKDNMLSLTPLILGPLAAVTGGDVNTATKASLELSIGLYALDKRLDSIMETAEEVLPPQYLVPLIAATTNLAEMGASQASALAGDPLAEVGSTPIGSNPTNLYLTGFALMAALKEKAVQEGHVKEGEKVGYRAIKETLKSMDWQGMKKQLGLSGMFAADALFFQFLVRPEMKKGNFMPLAGWTAVNLPLLVEYFRRTTFSKAGQMSNAIEGIGTTQVEKLKDELAESEEIDNEGAGALLKVANDLESYEEIKGDKQKKKETLKHTKEAMKEISKRLKEDEVFKLKVQEVLERADMKDMKKLFEVAGVKVDGREKVDAKKAGKLVFNIAIVVALAKVLDMGVTDMADAMPWLSKGAAGFFLMSFFSSIGEFLSTKKFFERGHDESAVKNIADSNAINIGLAKASMATSYIKGII